MTTLDPTMKLSDKALAPCPFCGGEPESEPWHGGAPTKIMIRCSNADYGDEHGGCSVGPMVTGETPAEAIAAWNRRASVQAEPVAVAVKPLEWEGFSARSPLGALYEIVRLSSSVWQTLWNGTAFPGWSPTEGQARAVAQADFERRSALVATPPSDEAAACRCDRCGATIAEDVNVPDEVWARIAPKPVEGFKGGGLLCAQCIVTALATPPAERVAWRTRGMNGRGGWLDWQMITEKLARIWMSDPSYKNGRRQVEPLYTHPIQPAERVVEATEEMAEAFSAGVNSYWKGRRSGHEGDAILAGLHAALAAAPAIKDDERVKPLTWTEAKALGGGRKLIALDCFHNEFHRIDLPKDAGAVHREQETAQRRYERCIRSALAAKDGQNG